MLSASCAVASHARSSAQTRRKAWAPSRRGTAFFAASSRLAFNAADRGRSSQSASATSTAARPLRASATLASAAADVDVSQDVKSRSMLTTQACRSSARRFASRSASSACASAPMPSASVTWSQ